MTSTGQPILVILTRFLSLTIARNRRNHSSQVARRLTVGHWKRLLAQRMEWIHVGGIVIEEPDDVLEGPRLRIDHGLIIKPSETLVV